MAEDMLGWVAGHEDKQKHISQKQVILFYSRVTETQAALPRNACDAPSQREVFNKRSGVFEVMGKWFVWWRKWRVWLLSPLHDSKHTPADMKTSLNKFITF